MIFFVRCPSGTNQTTHHTQMDRPRKRALELERASIPSERSTDDHWLGAVIPDPYSLYSTLRQRKLQRIFGSVPGESRQCAPNELPVSRSSKKQLSDLLAHLREEDVDDTTLEGRLYDFHQLLTSGAVSPNASTRNGRRLLTSMLQEPDVHAGTYLFFMVLQLVHHGACVDVADFEALLSNSQLSIRFPAVYRKLGHLLSVYRLVFGSGLTESPIQIGGTVTQQYRIELWHNDAVRRRNELRNYMDLRLARMAFSGADETENPYSDRLLASVALAEGVEFTELLPTNVSPQTYMSVLLEFWRRRVEQEEKQWQETWNHLSQWWSDTKTAVKEAFVSSASAIDQE